MLVGKPSFRAFRRGRDRAERSSGNDATRQKVEVGEEEDMVDPKVTSALGGARGAPNEADRLKDPRNQVRSPRGRV